MDLNKVNIEKLPADVRSLQALQVLHAEKRYRTKLRMTFYLL